MTATTLQLVTHLAVVIALLIVFAVTGDHEVLAAALGYAGAGSVATGVSKIST